MKQSISRRTLLANSAATGVVLGLSATRGLAYPVAPVKLTHNAGETTCRDAHVRIMNELAATARNSHNHPGTINHELKTSRCPHCETQIGLDPALV